MDAFILIDIWRTSQWGSYATCRACSLLEKEDAMWIVYLVVVLVGLVFGVLSLVSLETEA